MVKQFICQNCSEDISINDVNRVYLDGSSNFTLLCNDCMCRLTSCDCCGYATFDESLISFIEHLDAYLCNDCIENVYSRCDGCDRLFRDNDLTTTTNEDGETVSLCDDCYSSDNDISENKLPDDKFVKSNSFKQNKSNRFVGMEIETVNLSPDELKNKVKSNKELNDKFYNYALNIDYDGSLSNGAEIRCKPANGDELFNQIDFMCDYLKSVGCATNKRCGLHIHIDARDLNDNDLKKIYMTYSVFQKQLFKVVNKYRQNNNYCEKLYEDRLINLMNNNIYNVIYGVNNNRIKLNNSTIYDRHSHERYKFINATTFKCLGTIEIRLLEGTLNSEKIKNWIKLNLNLFNFALNTPLKRLVSLKSNDDTFLRIINDKKLRKYINKKISRKQNEEFNKKFIIRNIKDIANNNGLNNNKIIENIELLFREPFVSFLKEFYIYPQSMSGENYYKKMDNILNFICKLKQVSYIRYSENYEEYKTRLKRVRVNRLISLYYSRENEYINGVLDEVLTGVPDDLNESGEYSNRYKAIWVYYDLVTTNKFNKEYKVITNNEQRVWRIEENV